MTGARSILIITNDEPLGLAVAGSIERVLGSGFHAFRLTYADCVFRLTTQLLQQVDFVILELMRYYPGGLRAEGLTLAQRLARNAKTVLIISPLHLASQLNCRMYWDASSRDSLSDRVVRISAGSKNDPKELAALSLHFASLLNLPPQHH